MKEKAYFSTIAILIFPHLYIRIRLVLVAAKNLK